MEKENEANRTKNNNKLEKKLSVKKQDSERKEKTKDMKSYQRNKKKQEIINNYRLLKNLIGKTKKK